MHTADTGELLLMWERGAAETLPQRALSMMAVATGSAARDPLSEYPVGARDQLLIAWRERLFGVRMDTLTRCMHCSEPLEFAVRTDAIRADAAERNRTERITYEGWAVEFRLPTAGDLVWLAGTRDGDEPALRLLQRCTIAATEGDRTVEARSLPAAAQAAVAERMAECDPQADTVFEIGCPACGQASSIVFDIVSYLWAEIDAWARSILREVHLLARAYGWREADILDMTPLRRRFYLDLLAG